MSDMDMLDVAGYAEDDVRALCGRLLAGEPDCGEELAGDAALRSEVAARLAACGVTLIVRPGQPAVCVIQDARELPELPMACLALCALVLGTPAASTTGAPARARVDVKDIWERVGRRNGYSQAYVRRAGLGPLEARGLVKVVRPDQRASDAYVVAGPALAAVDRDLVAARLKALRDHERAA